MTPEAPRSPEYGVPGSTGVSRQDPSAEDEKNLVKRIQAGEPELFYRLVRPYERRVYAIVFAILRNEGDAEDAVQEAFLKGFIHIGQFRAESRFSTWLVQIAINEARMRIRKSRHEIVTPMETQEEEDAAYEPRHLMDWRDIPSESLQRKEVREKLIAALGSLTQKYREVFVLRDVQHMSTEDTANTLGISEGLVKTRLLRARLMLRDLLAVGFDSFYGGPSHFPKGTKPWT